MIQILFPLLSILPLGLLAIVVRLWRGWDAARGAQWPVREKSLHRPGESTRKRIEQLDRQIQDLAGLGFALLPILGASYFFSIRNAINPPPSIWVPHLAVAVIAYTWVFVRLARLLGQRRHLRLALSGEKTVGGELNHLIADNCRVFHDFPLAANWNIDHVVVAPSGVYAVETKSRRKGPFCRTQRPHEVVYDGEGLQFPRYYDREMLGQAQRQADRLSQFLTDALEAHVPVTPVLALPGWLVRREASNGVEVLNEYQLHSLSSASRPSSLSADAVARIAAQLDGRCRDVEG